MPNLGVLSLVIFMALSWAVCITCVNHQHPSLQWEFCWVGVLFLLFLTFLIFLTQQSHCISSAFCIFHGNWVLQGWNLFQFLCGNNIEKFQVCPSLVGQAILARVYWVFWSINTPWSICPAAVTVLVSPSHPHVSSWLLNLVFAV